MPKRIVAREFSFSRQTGSERTKRCQQKKRQAGLCIGCGKPSDKFRCNECRKVHNEETKQLRDKRIEDGKCEKCGGENITDTTMCADCQKKLNQRRRESYKKGSEKWAAEKMQQGLCRACGGPREDQSIQHCAKCKRARNSRRLKSLYGITIDEYEELAALQDWVCWICKKKETTKDGFLHVDHDHKTGKVRALLCGKCNQGIGCLRESPELLERAAEYLRVFKSD